LTEAELNSEQAYVLAKNRLHNRYLHGWGVVCGLEVVCHDCEGWVTVREGYALDACGNDIVVCQDTDFNVIKAIEDLCNTRRRKSYADCQPMDPGLQKSCNDLDERWCITLTYEEKETRPTTALRRPGKGTCSCGCGSNCGNGCGCGCNGSNGKSNGKSGGCGCGSNGSKATNASYTQAGSGSTYSSAATAVRSGVGTVIAPCEPTRILESYRLGVCEADCCCNDETPTQLDPELRRKLEFLGKYLPPQYGLIVSALIRYAPKDTLLVRILNCLAVAGEFMVKRVPVQSWSVLAPVLVAPKSGQGLNIIQDVETRAADQYEAFCRYYVAVRDLYVRNPNNVRCATVAQLNKIDCPPPMLEESPQLYAGRVQEPLQQTTSLLLRYILDCICEALLPPCSADPSDTKLVLACVTMRDGKIIDICNFSCRRYAGSFPATSYWLSLVPVLPMLARLIERLCCDTDILRWFAPREFQREGPGMWRMMMTHGNFAFPKMYISRLAQMFGKIIPSGVAERITPEAIVLTGMVARPFKEVQTGLTNKGIAVIERQVNSEAEVPVRGLKETAEGAFALPGERVVLYTMGDKVVGAERIMAPGKPEEVGGTEEPSASALDAMRAELAALRREVADLKKKS
jgi:hypothetical protein